MKNIRLLPLILLSGCVNWTPAEYYDTPPEVEDNEQRYVIERDDDGLCVGEPLGTFSCADVVESPDSTQCITKLNSDCIGSIDQLVNLPW
jgi:hypothetical protein